MRLVYQDQEQFVFSDRRRKSLDYPLHLHGAVEMVFLTQGSCRVTNDGESIFLEAGDVFVSFPNQVHSYAQSRDTEGYLLILPLKPWLQSYYQSLTHYVPVSSHLQKGQWEHNGLPQIIEQACRDKHTAPDPVMQGYFQVIVGKLLEMLQLKERSARSDEGVWSVLSYIHGHYQEPLTRRSIALALGYNESYISHFFSENVKMSLGSYIQSLRVEDALHLLERTELPIAWIATQTGFGSIRSFNRAFREIIGQSPREYRIQKK